MRYCTIRAPNPAAPRKREGQNIGRVIVTGTGAGDYGRASGICSKERTLGYSANSRGGLRGVALVSASPHIVARCRRPLEVSATRKLRWVQLWSRPRRPLSQALCKSS